MNLGRIVAALRRHPLVADVILAVALATLAAVTGVALVAPRAQAEPPSTPLIVAWAAFLAAPLVLRRRWPLVVLAVTTLHFTHYWAVGQVNEIASWVILGVAIYSAAAYADRRRAGWVYGACLLWLIGSGVVLSAQAGPIGVVEVAAIAMFDALPFLLAWPLGAMMRRLREYRAALEERNRQLDQEREVNARRAVLEERVRIARELHDVVAHHVSVMGVQAGVARRLFDRDPAEAVTAIGSVEAASRQAIADLQQLVGVLRRQEEGDDLAPQPSLGRLPELVEHMRQAGLAVELTVQGRQGGCRRAWSCPPTASSKRRSPTPSSTPAPRRPPSSCATTTGRWRSRWSTTDRARHRLGRERAGRGWSACRSGCACTAAAWRLGPVRAAASGSTRYSGTADHDDHGGPGRRPGPGPERLPDDP
jgi:signal transduction histidine kinase